MSRNHPVMIMLLAVLMLTLAGLQPLNAAPIIVVDDNGHQIVLSTPAQRIISLAPNITELLYTIGAGTQIVGTIEQSNYPEAATTKPRIGNHHSLDIESIIALKPDLIIAWPSGNPRQQVQLFQQLKIPVFNCEPRHLADIPDTIERLGQLTGNTAPATEVAKNMRQAILTLRQGHQQDRAVRVFFQVWEHPLYTINGDHLISDIIQLCGGQNVFAELPALSPRVSIEAVVQANPEVIITTMEGGDKPVTLQQWQQWPQLQASQKGHLFGIEPDAISVNSTRILTGTQRLCQILDQVRHTGD